MLQEVGRKDEIERLRWKVVIDTFRIAYAVRYSFDGCGLKSALIQFGARERRYARCQETGLVSVTSADFQSARKGMGGTCTKDAVELPRPEPVKMLGPTGLDGHARGATSFASSERWERAEGRLGRYGPSCAIGRPDVGSVHVISGASTNVLATSTAGGAESVNGPSETRTGGVLLKSPEMATVTRSPRFIHVAVPSLEGPSP